MTEKEKVEESLKNIINNIDKFERGDIDWYRRQVTVDYDENESFRSIDERLMTKAFKYPELHPLMRDVVKVITESNANISEMWDQDEEHAGTNAALFLALANKEDVPLYAYFITTNDLNHPVYQEGDWVDVFAKWGECEETLLLLIAITLTPSQQFDDLEDYWQDFIPFLKEDANIDLFFRQLHFFILWVNKRRVFRFDISGLLNERMPEFLADKDASDETLVAHLVNAFLEYPEVPEPPTLTILRKGYDE